MNVIGNMIDKSFNGIQRVFLMSDKKLKNKTKKWEIPGIPDEVSKNIKVEDRKKFLSLMGRLYLRSSEEVIIEEIFNKALRIFIREKLFNDGVLNLIVKYAYDNDLNSFNKDGTINKHLIEHIKENSKEEEFLYNYMVNENIIT